jgi:hypothetical protein
MKGIANAHTIMYILHVESSPAVASINGHAMPKAKTINSAFCHDSMLRPPSFFGLFLVKLVMLVSAFLAELAVGSVHEHFLAAFGAGLVVFWEQVLQGGLHLYASFLSDTIPLLVSKGVYIPLSFLPEKTSSPLF